MLRKDFKEPSDWFSTTDSLLALNHAQQQINHDLENNDA